MFWAWIAGIMNLPGSLFLETLCSIINCFFKILELWLNIRKTGEG